MIEQFATNPLVLEAPERPCVGGPCDGQTMRAPDGHCVVISGRVDRSPRAVSLTRSSVRLMMDSPEINSNTFGVYELFRGELRWMPNE